MAAALRLRVSLRDVEPQVWRLVDVRPDSTLSELHDVLQAAMGWEDAHLHAFRVGQTLYAPAGDEVADHDETAVAIASLPRRFTYLYDWGDGWEHDVELQGEVEADRVPGVVDGARACPPEDCGGWPGYDELLTAAADPYHPRRQHALLLGDPEAFDLGAADELVRVLVPAGQGRPEVADEDARAPGSVRLLLDLVGAGLRLTPAGRLPRALVRQVQEQRPHWGWDPQRPAHREDDLRPLLHLHDLLRRAGLLRLAHGRLSTTKAAASDTEVVRRLRAALFPDDFLGLLHRWLLERVRDAGPVRERALVLAATRTVARGWGTAERALDVHDLGRLVAQAGQLLVGLDAVVESGSLGEETWAITPSGLLLLGG